MAQLTRVRTRSVTGRRLKPKFSTSIIEDGWTIERAGRTWRIQAPPGIDRFIAPECRFTTVPRTEKQAREFLRFMSAMHASGVRKVRAALRDAIGF